MTLKLSASGTADAITVLSRLDKDAYKQMVKGVKVIIKEAQVVAQGKTPPMGIVSLSGQGGWGKWNRRGNASDPIDFNGNAVRASIKTSVRKKNKSSRKGASFTGIITSKSAPGAIFQTIGRGANRNSQFSREVIRQHGKPESRFIWGAKQSVIASRADERIADLIDVAAKQAQANLDRINADVAKTAPLTS